MHRGIGYCKQLIKRTKFGMALSEYGHIDEQRFVKVKKCLEGLTSDEVIYSKL